VAEAVIDRSCRARPPIRSLVRARSAEASPTGRDRTLWSVLGPQPMGEPRTTMDKSGHQTLIETAGRHAYGPLTSGGTDRRRGVRVSPPPPKGLVTDQALGLSEGSYRAVGQQANGTSGQLEVSISDGGPGHEA
jgi:hypothetical protein